MQCLNCQADMHETIYEGVEIDVCPECVGVWLDDSELATIIDLEERSWPPGVIERVLEVTGVMGVPAHELSKDVHCPKCQLLLEPVNYQGTSGVIVNTCSKKHGVWLDHGELAKIQIFIEHWRKTYKHDPS